MLALPAGLRKMPAEMAAATTRGVFQKIIGTASGTQLHAVATARLPVRNRSMIRGAAIAPEQPEQPGRGLDQADLHAARTRLR